MLFSSRKKWTVLFHFQGIRRMPINHISTTPSLVVCYILARTHILRSHFEGNHSRVCDLWRNRTRISHAPTTINGKEESPNAFFFYLPMFFTAARFQILFVWIIWIFHVDAAAISQIKSITVIVLFVVVAVTIYIVTGAAASSIAFVTIRVLMYFESHVIAISI